MFNNNIIMFFGQCSYKDTNNNTQFDLEHKEMMSQVPCLCSPEEKCQLCINIQQLIARAKETRDNETKLTPDFLWDYGKYKTLDMSLGSVALNFVIIFVLFIFLIIITAIVNSNNTCHCNN